MKNHISLPEISGKYQENGHIVTKVNHAVSDQFGGYEEVLALSLLAVIGTILHLILIKSLLSLDKSWTLTHKLIILSSAFQTIYLTVIAIPELIHLATQEWSYGNLACKIYSTMKMISSGISINSTVVIITEKAFGTLYPIKRYHCIQTSYYQLKMIILTFTMSLLSGLPRFYLSGIVLDESHNRTECVGHSQMSKADHIMHFCWCIYVLIFFYVLPTLVSISSSCFLWCKVKPYDFGTVINSSDSVNDRISLNSQASVDLYRLAKYTLLESVFYFACWGPLHLSGSISKIIQEEMMWMEIKDSWMASIINTIFGSDRTNHVAYLRVLILVSRLLTYIYFALWPTLHLSRMRHAIKKSSRSQTKLFDTSLASGNKSSCQSGIVLNKTGNALPN